MQVIRGSSLVYDSALAYRYDLGGQTYKNPATAWAMNGYWQTLNGNNSYGLVYRDLISTDTFVSSQYYPWKVVNPDPLVLPRVTSMSEPTIFDYDSYRYKMPEDL